MRRESKGIAAAAAIAPLAVVPALLLVAAWIHIHAKITSESPKTMMESVSAFITTSLFAVPTAYALMLMVGAPAAVAALKLGCFRLSTALGLGALLGAVTAVALKGGEVEFPSFFFVVFAGAFVAGAFYFLVRRFNGESPRGAHPTAG